MSGNKLVIVRGGGDLATGTICRLHRAGYQVLVLEIPRPTVIRRTVALAQCVYEGEAEVEGVQASLVSTPEEALGLLDKGLIPVLIDPEGDSIKVIKPLAVVDAILAKRNTGTRMDWAPIVIGLGPGFFAGKDVHAVVETKRGHDLGRVYYEGQALPNTGIPGEISGYSEERVVRSPAAGVFRPVTKIGASVEKGQVLGYVGQVPVPAPLTGILRGLINGGLDINPGMKIGDVDPRAVLESCWTISDKARAVGGGVLEALLYYLS